MKKILLSLLVIVLALGLLGAAGAAGYRYGFTQGMVVASAQSNNGNGNRNVQPWGPGFGMMRRGMPMYNFGYGRGVDRDGFGVMRRGGFGFFPLLGGLLWLFFLGLIVAGIVWLINRSGWRLTRTAPAVVTPPPAAPVVETPPPANPDENQENLP